ncbi:hypothetical protein GCM10007108_13360 [Thermogymnomonas acidicola]|uniref:Uncharacterized protein n=1 Tax=Thermogymnomonas acidicola TaxID=399579 RepID=A0AA37BRZ7_9ARCH|nr:hypothetical protein GCM10007108_13360 [Thermogymnomonas acidicola]
MVYSPSPLYKGNVYKILGQIGDLVYFLVWSSSLINGRGVSRYYYEW